MKQFFVKTGSVLSNQKSVLTIFIVLAIFASIQSYFGDLTKLNYGDNLYTQYGNYLIFKYSFYHLIDLKDLYIHYPSECGDLYKYSPSFPLLFAPFALLPDLPGLIFWNLLNGLVLFFAIKSLPGFERNTKSYMLWFVIIETMTSMQNNQSNGLIAGLLIFSFVFLEKDKYALGTLFIVLTAFIKLFGIVAFVFFIFYPKKIRFFIFSVLWVLLLVVLPVIVISFEQLEILYRSWGKLLAADHSISYGFSLMGWLNTWFGLEINKNMAVLVGAILFMLPLIRFKYYNELRYRLLFLASILIWIVIFNHKAESPTFVIAMSGLAIWFFLRKITPAVLVFILLAFVFGSLTTTDIFPYFIRQNYLYPYVVKALPSILIWFILSYELLFFSAHEQIEFFENRSINEQ